MQNFIVSLCQFDGFFFSPLDIFFVFIYKKSAIFYSSILFVFYVFEIEFNFEKRMLLVMEGWR